MTGVRGQRGFGKYDLLSGIILTILVTAFPVLFFPSLLFCSLYVTAVCNIVYVLWLIMESATLIFYFLFFLNVAIATSILAVLAGYHAPYSSVDLTFKRLNVSKST